MVRRVTRASALLLGCLLAGVALGLLGRATVVTSGRAFDRLEVDLSLVSPRTADRSSPVRPPAGGASPSRVVHDSCRDEARFEQAPRTARRRSAALPLLPPLPVYGFEPGCRDGDLLDDGGISHPRFALYEDSASEPKLPPGPELTPPLPDGVLPPVPESPPGARSETKTAENDLPPTAPERLPDLDRHAAPIEPKAEGSPRADDAVLRKIIERELPEATAQERQIWLDELRGLSASAVRDLLQLRRMINKPGPEIRLVPPGTTDGEAPRFAHRPRPNDVPGLPGHDGECPVPEFDAFHPLPPLPESSLATVETSTAALREACSVVVNNLANARTAGYKRVQLVLSDLPYDRLAASADEDDEEAALDETPSIGLGVYVSATEVDASQGELRATGNPCDVAIDGRGWFAVRLGDEVRYTRAGRFRIDAGKNLALLLGTRKWPVEPPVAIPGNTVAVEFTLEGLVKAQGSEQSPVEVGRIQLTQIAEGVSLVPCGNGMYAARESVGVVGAPGGEGLGQLRSGRLEMSNVKVREELEELQQLQTLWRAIRTATPQP